MTTSKVGRPCTLRLPFYRAASQPLVGASPCEALTPRNACRQLPGFADRKCPLTTNGGMNRAPAGRSSLPTRAVLAPPSRPGDAPAHKGRRFRSGSDRAGSPIRRSGSVETNGMTPSKVGPFFTLMLAARSPGGGRFFVGASPRTSASLDAHRESLGFADRKYPPPTNGSVIPTRFRRPGLPTKAAHLPPRSAGWRGLGRPHLPPSSHPLPGFAGRHRRRKRDRAQVSAASGFADPAVHPLTLGGMSKDQVSRPSLIDLLGDCFGGQA